MLYTITRNFYPILGFIAFVLLLKECNLKSTHRKTWAMTPFDVTLPTQQQQIVPNVTHGHLQGDNTKRVEVENKGRESMVKRWRGNAHEKKEDSFLECYFCYLFFNLKAIRWSDGSTVHEITRYSPFILLFPFTILFPISSFTTVDLHHLSPFSTLHSYAYRHKTHNRQKYILNTSYGTALW